MSSSRCALPVSRGTESTRCRRASSALRRSGRRWTGCTRGSRAPGARGAGRVHFRQIGLYLQPGVVVVCPGGWHLPTCGPELPFPPPLLPGPNAGAANAGAAMARAETDRTTASILRRMSLYLLARLPSSHVAAWSVRFYPILGRRARSAPPPSRRMGRADASRVGVATSEVYKGLDGDSQCPLHRPRRTRTSRLESPSVRRPFTVRRRGAKASAEALVVGVGPDRTSFEPA